MSILVLGGNVALGARAPRGWPEHLWELTGVRVVNGAVRGARMVDIVRQISQLPTGPFDWIVIQAGSYDARGGGTPPAEYGLLLRQALGELRHRYVVRGSRLALCTPTPIGASALPGFNRSTRRWVTRAIPVVAEIAQDEEVVLVPLHELPKTVLSDGVHLSSAGASVVATMVGRYLELYSRL